VEQEAKETDLSEEELSAIGLGEEPMTLDDVDSSDKAIPEWVVIPGDLKVPPGRQLMFVRFRAAWTDNPSKGDRHCIMWNLTEGDEKLALKRTRGDSYRTIDELTKQSIRAIDGVRADWISPTAVGSVSAFWTEIGGKCRQQLKNFYVKTHTLSTEETVDFFTNCIDVRTGTT
jgi:hypothetical protein